MVIFQVRPSILYFCRSFNLLFGSQVSASHCRLDIYLAVAEPPKYCICKIKLSYISSLFLFLYFYPNSLASAQHGILDIVILNLSTPSLTLPYSTPKQSLNTLFFFFLILLKSQYISPHLPFSFPFSIATILFQGTHWFLAQLSFLLGLPYFKVSLPVYFSHCSQGDLAKGQSYLVFPLKFFRKTSFWTKDKVQFP